jgi:Fe2+ transport system protein FeoA
MKLRPWKRHARFKHFTPHDTCPRKQVCPCTLFDVPAGETVVLLGYLPGMPGQRRAQLQAYGLLPGSQLRLLQHQPVVVIRIAHLELALEWDLAHAMEVEICSTVGEGAS